MRRTTPLFQLTKRKCKIIENYKLERGRAAFYLRLIAHNLLPNYGLLNFPSIVCTCT